MISSQPQTIADKLVGEIFDWLYSNAMPTEFEMRRMMRDAEKLTLIDPLGGALASGGLAALKWDLDKVDEQMKILLKNDTSPTTLCNASILYKLINDTGRTLELTHQAWNSAQTNPVFCSAYLAALGRAGWLEEANKMREFLVHGPIANVQAELLSQTIFGMHEIGIRQEQVVQQLSVANVVMTEHCIRNRETLFRIQHDPDDGHASLLAVIKFAGDYDLEEKLAEATAERSIDIPNWNPALFTLSFIPHSEIEDELQPA